MRVAAGRTRPRTVEDVLALPEDRTTRCELLGESLVLSPAPGVRHQRASFRLAAVLHAACAAAGGQDEVLEAVGVVLPSGLAVPDLVVADTGVTAGDGAAVDVDGVRLVVEVVSPGSRVMDREVKPAFYAEAAVPHLWLLELDPVPRLVAHELDAERGEYAKRTTALSGATTRLTAPFPVEIDPAALVRQ